MKIYLDEVFLINFVMDFFVLWSASRLGKLDTSWKRLFMGSCIGAVYGVLIFLPIRLNMGHIFAKIACSLIMAVVAYRAYTIPIFMKAVGYLYLVAFIMGGAVLGSMYLWGNGSIQTWNGIALVSVDFQLVWLSIGIITALLLAFWGGNYIRRNVQQGIWLVNVAVGFGNETIRAKALVDTGNHLVDPLTKTPVIIMQYMELVKILPKELVELFKYTKLPTIEEQMAIIAESDLAYKVRVIPFTSIGQQNGMLLAIRPDWLSIEDGRKVYPNCQGIIAIYGKRLCSQGTYQALAHPDLLYNGVKAGEE